MTRKEKTDLIRELRTEISAIKDELRKCRQQGVGDLLGLIDYQKVLLIRAADRIHMWVDAGLDPSMETKNLIDELRKAAQ
jgi:hypothetical protein